MKVIMGKSVFLCGEEQDREVLAKKEPNLYGKRG